MKIILIAAFISFIFFPCYSQADKSSFNLSEIKATEITLVTPLVTTGGKKRISGLIVIDARFDTSSYGLFQNYPNKYYSIVSAKSAADDTRNFLRNYLEITSTNNGTDKKIIMVIKKLWATSALQQEIVDEAEKSDSETGGIIAKFEFYCSNGEGYSPLYRFDTAVGDLKSMRRDAAESISRVLALSVQQLLSTSLTTVSLPGKIMSLEEIMVYSSQQANIPIVAATIYKKGVYRTFNDFKMNDPSILNYEIEEDKLTKTIFLNEGKGAYPVRDLWGYCDGRHIYINSADNYFELVKKGNTFISNAALTLSRRRSLKAGNVLMLGVVGGGIGRGNKKTTYSLSRKLYELDMDTGELY